MRWVFVFVPVWAVEIILGERDHELASGFTRYPSPQKGTLSADIQSGEGHEYGDECGAPGRLTLAQTASIIRCSGIAQPAIHRKRQRKPLTQFLAARGLQSFFAKAPTSWAYPGGRPRNLCFGTSVSLRAAIHPHTKQGTFGQF